MLLRQTKSINYLYLTPYNLGFLSKISEYFQLSLEVRNCRVHYLDHLKTKPVSLSYILDGKKCKFNSVILFSGKKIFHLVGNYFHSHTWVDG